MTSVRQRRKRKGKKRWSVVEHREEEEEDRSRVAEVRLERLLDFDEAHLGGRVIWSKEVGRWVRRMFVGGVVRGKDG